MRDFFEIKFCDLRLFKMQVFFSRFLLFALTLLSFFSCQHKGVKRDDPIGMAAPLDPAPDQSMINSPLSESSLSQLPPTLPKVVSAPKVKWGIILGPGALRASAHGGVLTHFYKRKLNIQWIAGVEVGAVAAALYALNPSPYEVQWHFLKWKQKIVYKKNGLFETGLFTRPDTEFLLPNKLKKLSLDKAKINFTCPSYSLDNNKTYLFDKGIAYNVISMCAINFYQDDKAQTFSDPLALKELIVKGRFKADQIIYIDVLSNLSESDHFIQSYWSQIRHHHLEIIKSENVLLIQLPLSGSIYDSNQINKWIDQGQSFAEQFQTESDLINH